MLSLCSTSQCCSIPFPSHPMQWHAWMHAACSLARSLHPMQRSVSYSKAKPTQENKRKQEKTTSTAEERRLGKSVPRVQSLRLDSLLPPRPMTTLLLFPCPGPPLREDLLLSPANLTTLPLFSCCCWPHQASGLPPSLSRSICPFTAATCSSVVISLLIGAGVLMCAPSRVRDKRSSSER